MPNGKAIAGGDSMALAENKNMSAVSSGIRFVNINRRRGGMSGRSQASIRAVEEQSPSLAVGTCRRMYHGRGNYLASRHGKRANENMPSMLNKRRGSHREMT